jgi:general secretion pathway protein G
MQWLGFARRRGARVRRGKRGEEGFTLVEMLVVITIIGIVMALVGPRVLGYLGESKVKAAKIQIESLSAALDLYFLDNGTYPSSDEGLGALVRRPSSARSWNGPYLRTGSVPDDPWGHPYAYKAPGETGPYEIDSFGPGSIGDSQNIIRSASR